MYVIEVVQYLFLFWTSLPTFESGSQAYYNSHSNIITYCLKVDTDYLPGEDWLQNGIFFHLGSTGGYLLAF